MASDFLALTAEGIMRERMEGGVTSRCAEAHATVDSGAGHRPQAQGRVMHLALASPAPVVEESFRSSLVVHSLLE